MPVMLCGNNGDGQLGQPRGQRDTRALADAPFILRMPPDCSRQRVVMAAAGSGHTLLLTSEGCVLSFGRGDDGRLGLGGGDWVTEPAVVRNWDGQAPGGSPAGPQNTGQGGSRTGQPTSGVAPAVSPGGSAAPRIIFIAAGSYHSAAVADNGTLYTWGGGMFGKCGHGGPTDTASFVPRPVAALAGRHVLHVACGSKHTVALVASPGLTGLSEHHSAEVWAWGDTGHGVLGHGQGVTGPVRTPARVEAMQGLGVCQLAVCGSHNMAITSHGELYAWGEGKYGRLGLGDEEDAWLPTRVGGPLHDNRVVAASAGGCHSLALTSQGQVFAWGGGEHGQLGLGGTANSTVPVWVRGLSRYFVTQVASGWSHSVFLAEPPEGDPTAAGAPIILATGNGDHGKLGTGRKDRMLVPERIPAFAGLGVTSIVSYNEHNCILTAPDGPALLPWDDESMVLGMAHPSQVPLGAAARAAYVRPEHYAVVVDGQVADTAGGPKPSPQGPGQPQAFDFSTFTSGGSGVSEGDLLGLGGAQALGTAVGASGHLGGAGPAFSPLGPGGQPGPRSSRGPSNLSLSLPGGSAAGLSGAHSAYYSRGLDWTRARDGGPRDSRTTPRAGTSRLGDKRPGTPLAGPSRTGAGAGVGYSTGMTPRGETPRASVGGGPGPMPSPRLVVRTDLAAAMSGGAGPEPGLGLGLPGTSGYVPSPTMHGSAAGQRTSPPSSQTGYVAGAGMGPSPSPAAGSGAALGLGLAGAASAQGGASLLHDLAWMVDNRAAFPDVVFYCEPEDGQGEEEETQGMDMGVVQDGYGEASGQRHGAGSASEGHPGPIWPAPWSSASGAGPRTAVDAEPLPGSHATSAPGMDSMEAHTSPKPVGPAAEGRRASQAGLSVPVVPVGSAGPWPAAETDKGIGVGVTEGGGGPIYSTVFAHRGLLTARCPAFAAIFAWAAQSQPQTMVGPGAYGKPSAPSPAWQRQHAALTSSQGQGQPHMLPVPLPDVPRPALLHLLHALYTDTLPARSARWTELGAEDAMADAGEDLPGSHGASQSMGITSAGLGLAPEEVVELAALADRFCAPERLTRLCERRLERTLTADNCSAALEAAHSFGTGAAGIKRQILRYVARHFDAVSTTQGFRERIVPQQDLMWELLQVRQGGPAGGQGQAGGQGTRGPQAGGSGQAGSPPAVGTAARAAALPAGRPVAVTGRPGMGRGASAGPGGLAGALLGQTVAQLLRLRPREPLEVGDEDDDDADMR